MFYRRKVLLALIEAFGGSLTTTDCHNLLMLFYRSRGRHDYDFIPHEYGAFSFLLQQDQKRLNTLGLLISEDSFQLCHPQSFLGQLSLEDCIALHAFVQEIGNVRGDMLMLKVYLEYPYYAFRSKNASFLLNSVEYDCVCQALHAGRTPALFTVGYEGLSIDAYLNILLANNVTALLDVRKNPISRKYGFSKTKLTEFTRAADISYFHIPELGVPSTLRQDLNSVSAYQNLFEYYASQILPQQQEAIECLKSIVQEQGRVALTCFEADHQFCHRHKITEYLVNDPVFTIPVYHLDSSYTFDYCIGYTTGNDPVLVYAGNTLKAS